MDIRCECQYFLVDRIKNLLTLSNPQTIAPALVCSEIDQNPLLDEAFCTRNHRIIACWIEPFKALWIMNRSPDHCLQNLQNGYKQTLLYGVIRTSVVVIPHTLEFLLSLLLIQQLIIIIVHTKASIHLYINIYIYTKPKYFTNLKICMLLVVCCSSRIRKRSCLKCMSLLALFESIYSIVLISVTVCSLRRIIAALPWSQCSFYAGFQPIKNNF